MRHCCRAYVHIMPDGYLGPGLKLEKFVFMNFLSSWPRKVRKQVTNCKDLGTEINHTLRDNTRNFCLISPVLVVD